MIRDGLMRSESKQVTAGAVQLCAWMRATGRKRAAVAADLGVTINALDRFRNGWRRPSWSVAAKIEDITGGAVPARSWRSMEAT